MEQLLTRAENALLSNRALQDRVTSRTREVTQLSKSDKARRYNALWATAQKAKLEAKAPFVSPPPSAVAIPQDEARGHALKFVFSVGVLALFLINRPLQSNV